MSLPLRTMSTRVLALSLALLASACAISPPADALAEGQEVALEGQVTLVDTDPWAYDGNAVVTVSTASAGVVRVQLPARWNLCKAQPLEDIQSLAPGDKVEIAGTSTRAGEVVVCAQPQHRLRRIK